jgi:hypothetical protein
MLKTQNFTIIYKYYQGFSKPACTLSLLFPNELPTRCHCEEGVLPDDTCTQCGEQSPDLWKTPINREMASAKKRLTMTPRNDKLNSNMHPLKGCICHLTKKRTGKFPSTFTKTPVGAIVP